MAKAEDDPHAKSFALESLASRYIPEQHESYLRYLQEAVQDPRNLNIALTGRYGTGKSSILDEFESDSRKRRWRTWFRLKRKTVRITISTLGSNPVQPSAEGTAPEASTLTNRIQKELVKQLIYRTSPREFRFSRFTRIVPLSRVRAAARAAAAVFVIGGMLWLLKLVPNVLGAGSGRPWWVPGLSWLGIGVGAVILLATALRIIHGRFVVSDVSAAGATVKLSPRSATYFDEYSEDIVLFFNKELPDVVIFEDLDRFDDPHIFEALRELNTLLNQTPERRRKNSPLRFVYAIKDSLFERLGEDTEKVKHDAAAAEIVRANRTKFFDLVIPVVPFLSHRNARELLDSLFRKRGLIGIERTLVALVAQHTTDMRLLTNICNEYVVFADRLLKPGRTAPGLTASNLFALVAYKNFHLNDFEQIFRGDGDLQVLYTRRRDLVRAAIDECEKRKRDILNEPARHRTMDRMAERLASRLVEIGTTIKRASGHQAWQHLYFNVGGSQFPQDKLTSYGFWKAVSVRNTIVIIASRQPNGSDSQEVGRLERGQIEALFSEALNAGQWEELDEQANQTEIKLLDSDVELLRGADFQHLAQETRFTLSIEDSQKSFAAIVEETMKSQLARDLVKQGYLDRNFALYAAPFHGDFTGVDVATFIVQTVENNTMDIDYPFSGPEAIENLLGEAPAYFSRTISAYNVQILDHLLKKDDHRATDVADTIASNFGEDAEDFLRRYLNSGSERERFATLLSQRQWSGVFTHLVQDPDIPDDIRAALVDAALRGANDAGDYVLSSEVGRFIAENYAAMGAFTVRQSDDVVARVAAIADEATAVFLELAPLDGKVQGKIISRDMYRLTADNLRVALGLTGDVSVDRIGVDADVYGLCKRSPDEYLDVLRNDRLTSYSVLSEATLIEALNDLSADWNEDQVRELIAMASPDIRLERLDSVPDRFRWQALATHRLFRASARNVYAYRDAFGSFDESLANLIVEAGGIDSTDEDEDVKASVVIDVLNASRTIPEAGKRVELVANISLQDYVSPDRIEPQEGAFLALLLDDNRLRDSIESFTRFRDAGWSALEPAIGKSSRFTEFMTAELVSNFIPDLLRSSVVPRSAKEKVIANVAQYVPEDADALLAAGAYALTQKRSLPLAQVERIATTTHDANLTLGLLILLSPPTTEIVPVLVALGEPYGHLTNTVKNEIKVPADDQHRVILDLLKKGGAIASFRKMRDFYNVKLV
jgi:hypothetical protein